RQERKKNFLPSKQTGCGAAAGIDYPRDRHNYARPPQRPARRESRTRLNQPTLQKRSLAQGGSAMSNLRYRNYYISVFHVPDKSGNSSSCIFCFEICYKFDYELVVRLRFGVVFGGVWEVTEYGLAVGKRWVDDRLANPP